LSCESKEASVSRTCTINGVSVDPSQCDGISTPTNNPTALTEEISGFATITVPIQYDFENNSFKVSMDSFHTAEMNDHYQCIAGLKAGEYQVELIENQSLSLRVIGMSKDIKYESSVEYTETLNETVWIHLFEINDDSMNATINIESNLEFNEGLTRISIKVFCNATPM